MKKLSEYDKYEDGLLEAGLSFRSFVNLLLLV
jgi:hypothetical protein